jgi:hypothetical protein
LIDVLFTLSVVYYVLKYFKKHVNINFFCFRDIEEQMEAVWQSANSENVRIKDELKRNVTQLRKHPGLSEALDEQNRLNTIDISSDDNAVIKVTDD